MERLKFTILEHVKTHNTQYAIISRANSNGMFIFFCYIISMSSEKSEQESICLNIGTNKLTDMCTLFPQKRMFVDYFERTDSMTVENASTLYDTYCNIYNKIVDPQHVVICYKTN
jgi:hypothetical protein